MSSPRSFALTPRLSSKKPQPVASSTADGPHTNDGAAAAVDSTFLHVNSNRKKRKKKGVIISKPKKASCPSSSSSSSFKRGVKDGSLRDLALPLGMSFAAVVSQVLDDTNSSGDQIQHDDISLICTSAVKESVSNIYGNRFDCFLMNFEKSFISTLRTLRLIKETSVAGHRNRPFHVSVDSHGSSRVNKLSISEQENDNHSSFLHSSSYEAAEDDHVSAAAERFESIPPSTTMSNQIVLHGQLNQGLASASHCFAGTRSGQSILTTFEKSVTEQTRSNDLKTFEIGLIMRKLQLKESQLALSSYANVLEKIKISMGISKASFREEKLRNQMLDSRHAELLKRCIDLLVAGLIIMSICLAYGTYVYSYQRITEVTSSCSTIPKESKSRWIPNPMASFNSGWQILRCQAVALTRMFFGLVMIVAIAYSVFQRSAISTPTTMPVTFILLLGFLCGIAGKLCVDTLGGSGFYWLLFWEALCLLHFFANVFPSALYWVLYGPISTSPVKAEGRLVPYWQRRILFNITLSIVYPALSGLLPFASLGDWSDHFSKKVNCMISGNQE